MTMDRHMRESLDHWLTTPPEDRYIPQTREVTFTVVVKVDEMVNDAEAREMVEQSIEDVGGPESVISVTKVEE